MSETGRPEVTVHSRSNGWESETVHCLDKGLALPQIGVTIPLAAIYPR